MFDRVKWRRRLLGCLNDVIAVKFWLHDGRAVWMAVLFVNCFVLMYGLWVRVRGKGKGKGKGKG